MITLIDTSAWIEALRVKGKEDIRAKVREFLIFWIRGRILLINPLSLAMTKTPRLPMT